MSFLLLAGFLLLLALLITAACIMDSQMWHRCPKCQRYHNLHGILCKGRQPHPSNLVGKPRICPFCEAWGK